MDRRRCVRLGKELSGAISEGEGALEAIEIALRGLAPSERRAVFEAFSWRHMAALFEACEARPALSVEDLLPAHAQAGNTYRWLGVNSLPLFRRFEKRFYLPEAGAKQLLGYNHQRLMGLTGPGCFVARAAEPGAPASLVFDYTRVLELEPPGWPRVRPADKGAISRLVFGFMHDYVRSVCDGVLIGRAYKHARPTNDYFVLVQLEEGG